MNDDVNSSNEDDLTNSNNNSNTTANNNNNNNNNSTRRYYELQVGKFHILEVIVYIRKQDINWYNNGTTSGSDSGVVWDEIKDILSTHIIPRMFCKEIETFYYNKYPTKFPSPPGGGGGAAADADAVGIGSKNIAAKNNKRKRKRKQQDTSTKKTTGKGKKGSKNKINLDVVDDTDDDDKEDIPEKDIYYSFGNNIQVAYKREPIIGLAGSSSNNNKKNKASSSSLPISSTTLLYKDWNKSDNERTTTGKTQEKEEKEGNNNNNNGVSDTNTAMTYNDLRFRKLHKLSHRLLIWCNKNSDDGESSSSSFSHLHRPELIPMSSLFQKPPDGYEYYSDNDDDKDSS